MVGTKIHTTNFMVIDNSNRRTANVWRNSIDVFPTDLKEPISHMKVGRHVTWRIEITTQNFFMWESFSYFDHSFSFFKSRKWWSVLMNWSRIIFLEEVRNKKQTCKMVLLFLFTYTAIFILKNCFCLFCSGCWKKGD